MMAKNVHMNALTAMAKAKSAPPAPKPKAHHGKNLGKYLHPKKAAGRNS